MTTNSTASGRSRPRKAQGIKARGEHQAWCIETFGADRVREGRISVIYLAKWLAPGSDPRWPGYAGVTRDKEGELDRIFGPVKGRCLIIERRPEHPDADMLMIDSLDGAHSYNIPRRLAGSAFRYA